MKGVWQNQDKNENCFNLTVYLIKTKINQYDYSSHDLCCCIKNVQHDENTQAWK